MPLPNVTEAIPDNAKAKLPIEVTLLGIVTEERDEHL